MVCARQNSSGGKERLGRTSKRRDKYIRSLLIAGAVAILRHARNRATKDAASVPALLERKPTKVARRMSVNGHPPSRRLAHHADRDQPCGEIQSGQPGEEGGSSATR